MGIGNQDNQKSRTESIIFIRAQVIRDSAVAEELRSKLRGTVSASGPNAQALQQDSAGAYRPVTPRQRD